MKVHKSSDELQEIIDGYKTLIEVQRQEIFELKKIASCLLYTSPSPRDS